MRRLARSPKGATVFQRHAAKPRQRALGYLGYHYRQLRMEALEDRRLLSYTITPNPATINETAGSFAFTVSRSNSTGAATVYATTLQDQGYTNNGVYYVGLVDQAVNFSAGQSTVQVTLTINNPKYTSGSEAFSLIVQQNTTDPVTTYLAKDIFTIVNNYVAPATYTITPNPATINETAGSFAFTVSRSNSTGAATVYATTLQDQGYTNNGVYYVGLVDQAVNFSAGQSTVQVTLTINNPKYTSGSEAFSLIVQQNTTDPVTTYLAKDIFTIVNNYVAPATYTITPNPATINETAGSFAFTLSRSNSTGAATVYATTLQDQGYTNNGVYYVGLVDQAVNFSAGQSTVQVTLTINNPKYTSGSEAFSLIVQQNTTDPVTTYLAKDIFTIVNNYVAPATYTITPNPATINETAGSFAFTVSRSNSTGAATVYATTLQDQGYTNNGVYYVGLVDQAVNFSAGQSTVQVTLTINNPKYTSGSEAFSLIVQQNTTDPVTTYLAKDIFTIVNNYVAPATYTITPNPATINETAGSFAFTLSRSNSTGAATVYATTLQDQGYTNNGVYYVGLVDQVVNFSAGQSTVQVTLTINNPQYTSGSEAFSLIVQQNTTDPVTTYLAKDIFTIVNNYVAPATYTITPNPATINETAGSFAFTLSRSNSTGAATVCATTLQDQGYTNNGVYYVGLVDQAVNFSAGQSTVQVTLTINNPQYTSGSEAFSLIVQQNTTDPVTTYLAKDIFTIVNNYVAPATYTITPNPATINETAGSFAFTVSRSNSTGAATVYATTLQDQGYTNNGVYYVGLVDQAVNFSAGQSTVQVTLTINNPQYTSGSEAFSLIVQQNTTDPVTTYLAKDIFTIVNNYVNQRAWISSITTPTSPQSGNVTISYSLADGQSETCGIAVWYSPNEGTNWYSATPGSGGDGTIPLTSSPSGTAHTFVWASGSDIGNAADTNVKLYILPVDALGGGTAGTTGTFTVTPAVPAPIVATFEASSVSTNNAAMNGTVNPNGASTSAYFQYGTTTSYGSTGQTTTGIATTQNIQTVLTGLAPGTTYHYRIVASNSGGTSYGSDMSFTAFSPAVTLTLNVHAGSPSGALLSGVQVTGQDAAGNSFNQTTSSGGYVLLSGTPGMWQFTASEAGYPTNTWGQSITATGTKNAYLVQQAAATKEHLYSCQQPTGGPAGSIITPAVVVYIEDSSNNIVTSDQSSVTLTLSPGTATLGGAVTVSTVNGAATFSNLTVNAAGTYTLQATDGGDAPVTSQPFVVGSSPRDRLIQALDSLEQAVAAYQSACISVFAAADVPLAEFIVSNATIKSLAQNLLGDFRDNAVSAAAELLTDAVTGDAFNLAEAFVNPLLQDLIFSGTSWLESYVSDWANSGGLAGTTVAAQAYLQGYFNDQLNGDLASLGTSLTTIAASIPPTIPGSFPEPSVIACLNDLTGKVISFTPQLGVTHDGEVGWAVPGADLAALDNVDPVILGASSVQAQNVASEANFADKVGTINTWLSTDCTTLEAGGAVIAAVAAPSGIGATIGLGMYTVGSVLSGLSGFADLANNTYAVFTETSAVDTLRNDVGLVGRLFNAVGDEVASLANVPQTSLSTSIQVGPLSNVNVATAWLDNAADVQASVPVSNNGNTNGEVEAVLNVYKVNGSQRDLVAQAPSTGIVTVAGNSSANLEFNVEMPSASVFGTTTYDAVCELIDTDGTPTLWQGSPEKTFQATSKLMAFADDLGQTVVNGAIQAGQAANGLVQSASNAVEDVLHLNYPGSDMDLNVYDSAGDYVGYNYATGQVHLGIPGAEYYSAGPGSPESIEVPVSGDGQFYVEADALQTSGFESASVTVDELASHAATLATTADQITVGVAAGGSADFDLGVEEIGGQADLTGVGLTISDLSGPNGVVIPSSAITLNAPPATIAKGTESDVAFQLTAPTAVGSYQGSIEVTTSNGGNCLVPVDIDVFATPVFSNLSASSSIVHGTASVSFSGTIAAGTLIPPDTEVVAVTLNDVTHNAAIDSQGDFSILFNTSQLPASATPYPITYAYAGDASFKSVTDNTTTTLMVTPTPLIVTPANWTPAGLTLTLGGDSDLHVYTTGTTNDAVAKGVPANVANIAITSPSSAGYNLTIDSTAGNPIPAGGLTYSGAGGLIKTGPGIVALSDTNTYTGRTTVSAGTLIVTSASALPSRTSLTVGAGSIFVFGAINGVWAPAGSGTFSWGEGGNWQGGIAPGAPGNMGDTAVLGAALRSDTVTITLDSSRTLSSLTFSPSTGGSYVLSGSGSNSLQLANSGSSASIVVASGASAINAPVVLGDNVNVTAASGTSLTISGPISQSGGSHALTLSGKGSLTLSGTNNYTGGTFVIGGTLLVTASSALPNGGALTVAAGGTLIFDPSVQASPSAVVAATSAPIGASADTTAAPTVTSPVPSSLVLLVPTGADVSASGSVAMPGSVSVSNSAGDSLFQSAATVATPPVAFPLAVPAPSRQSKNLGKSAPASALGARAADRLVWPSTAKSVVVDLSWLRQVGDSSDNSDQHRKKDVAILAFDAVFAQYNQ